jgi:hypothetical protein
MRRQGSRRQSHSIVQPLRARTPWKIGVLLTRAEPAALAWGRREHSFREAVAGSAAEGQRHALERVRSEAMQTYEKIVSGLLFLSTAPIALMPSAIAVFTKNSRAVPVVAFNVLVWGALLLLAMGLPSPGVIPILIVWLVLLRVAIQPTPGGE